MARRSLYVETTGSAELRANLAKLGAATPMVVGLALREEGEAITDYAAETTVPRDFSTLAGSKFVREPELVAGGRVRVVLGFGGAAAPYAAAIHENPRAGKTGGVSPSGRKYRHWAKVGGWKYLERAINRFRRGLSARIGARIARQWAALLS